MKLIAVQGPGPAPMCVHLPDCTWAQPWAATPGNTAYPRVAVSIRRALDEHMHACQRCTKPGHGGGVSSDGVTHGMSSTYNRGCRCPDCTKANRVRTLFARASRAKRLAADPSLAEHGKHATYVNWDCRCDPCLQAQMAYHHQRKEKIK